jgi:gliding motility-associated-like protein
MVDAKTEKIFSCNGSIPSTQFAAGYRLLYADPDETSSLNYSFLWSPATYINNTTANPTYIILPAPPVPSPTGPPQGAITYNFTVQVTNTNYGCTASNTQTVVVQRPRKVFLPGGFSPNGDGLNDLFRPINLEDYPGSEFGIWNRWGNLMFYSYGPTSADYSWDGKYGGVPQEMGNYVWRVKVVGCPTNLYSTSSGEGVPYGNLLLIR